MFRPTHKGFTLIELLIVVAIIGILAAIAIPNFLEAQTRAKIARVQADQRTMAMALESYYVDHDSYPGLFEFWDNGHAPWNLQFPTCAVVLSTPVAYVSDALYEDPFKEGNDVEPLKKYIAYCTARRGNYAASNTWPKDCFALASWGPDRIDGCYVGNYPYRHGRVYDPTNGTTSEGDVYRGMPDIPQHWKYADLVALMHGSGDQSGFPRPEEEVNVFTYDPWEWYANNR